MTKMKLQIAHQVPGRIRMKVPSVKTNPELAEQIKQTFSVIPGIDQVTVICPGFALDCLETLEEIGIEGRKLFLDAGGGEFRLLPCLNERADWIEALGAIAGQHLLGWLGPGSRTS